MAGILANSASVTMVSGDTSADNTQAGFVTNETITLSASPAGTTYIWGLAKPSGASSRSSLSDSTSASISFTPDVAGTWTITVDVDGTDYVLRVTGTAVSVTSVANAHRFSPVTNASIPTPALGISMYYSSTDSRAAFKDTAGVVHPLDEASRTITAISDSDSPYTVLPADDIISADSSGGAVTINLPAAASSAKRVIVISGVNGGGSTSITADGSDSETIDGATTKAISTDYGSMQIYCNGTAWFSF